MRKLIKSLIITVLGIFLLGSSAFSTVKPASIFSDHMVLQQQSNVALWGWAKPSTKVKIVTSWNKQIYTKGIAYSTILYKS